MNRHLFDKLIGSGELLDVRRSGLDVDDIRGFLTQRSDELLHPLRTQELAGVGRYAPRRQEQEVPLAGRHQGAVQPHGARENLGEADTVIGAFLNPDDRESFAMAFGRALRTAKAG